MDDLRAAAPLGSPNRQPYGIGDLSLSSHSGQITLRDLRLCSARAHVAAVRGGSAAGGPPRGRQTTVQYGTVSEQVFHLCMRVLTPISGGAPLS